jgi:hypothetical protein
LPSGRLSPSPFGAESPRPSPSFAMSFRTKSVGQRPLKIFWITKSYGCRPTKSAMFEDLEVCFQKKKKTWKSTHLAKCLDGSFYCFLSNWPRFVMKTWHQVLRKRGTVWRSAITTKTSC